MTSKNSFLQISKWNFKKRFPYLILCFIGCFFFMPVFTFMNCMIGVQNIRTTMSYAGGQVLQQDLEWLQYNNLPIATFGEGIHFLLIIVMAIVFSITAFSWMNSIKKVDFYKALPIKEKARFAYIHINSIFMFLICYCVNLILNNLAVAYWGLYNVKYLQASLISFLYNLIAFLAVYFLVCIAQQVTGTSVLAVLGSLFLLGVEPLLMILKEFFKNEFYKTYFYYDRNSEMLAIKNGLLTPVGAYIRGYKGVSEVYENFMNIANYKNMLMPMLCLLIQAVVFAVVTYLLYRKRASYAGNNNITFSFAKPMIKVLVMLAASLSLGILFYELSNSSLAAGIFGLVSGVILVQIIMQFIMEGDFKQITKGIPSMIVGLVLSMIVSAYFPLNAKKYDSYLPDQDAIASVAIVRSGEYIKELYNLDFEYTSTRLFLLEQLEMNEPEVIESLVSTMKECIDHNLYTTANFYNFDESESLQVRYTLKNGKKVYRNYLIDLETVRSLYDVYYASESYKQNANPFVNDTYSLERSRSNGRVTNIEYTSYLNDFVNETWIDENDCEEMYQACKKDAEERTIEIENTEVPIGRIRFISRLPKVNEGYRVTYAQADMPVYRTDKYLLEVFAKKGITNTEVMKDDISRIAIRFDNVAANQTYDGRDFNYAVEDTAINVDENPTIQLDHGDEYFDELIDNSVTYDASGIKVDGNRMLEDYYYGTIFFENGSVNDVQFKKGSIPEELKALLNNQ